jgi:hypothetical protein
MKQTVADEALHGGGGSPTRALKISDCLAAAATAVVDPYRPPANAFVYAMANSAIDLFGSFQRSYASNAASFSYIAHEMGHGLGLRLEGAGDTPAGTITYADTFDLMSCDNCAFNSGVAFGQSPPMMNAPSRDRLGWIPRHLIATFGAGGATRSRFGIAPINNLNTTSPVLLRVPFDANNPFRYYTVELDAVDGSWAAGIRRDVVLVHEIKPDGTISLVGQRDLASPGPVFSGNGVRITLRSSANRIATVDVTGSIARACRPGWVWREAGPGDLVCVTPARRDQVREQNKLAPSRILTNGFCRSSFVWREAFADDHACVFPTARGEAAADNAAHKDRVNPARDGFGPNTCSSGYVWREIDDSDYVCVTPAKRTLARTLRAVSHRLADGTCVTGQVWREAVLGDHLCVTPRQRTDARLDNEAAIAHTVKGP